MIPNQRGSFEELFDYAKNRQKINTHCHQLPMREFEEFSLDALLRNTYINWCGIPWDSSPQSRLKLLEQLRFNSFFIWLQKSLMELYSSDDVLSELNWKKWDEKIHSAYQHPSHVNEVLAEKCGYQKLILDAYWKPGSDNGLPDRFMPTFRVNAFFFGCSTASADHDGNNPYRLYPRPFISDLDEYVAWVRDAIIAQKEAGSVALKIPIAYDRGLDFCEVKPATARGAFARLTAAKPHEIEPTENSTFPTNAPPGSAASGVTGADAGDVKTFQDYLFFQICHIAVETNLPLQIHTGMGQGTRTNALQLRESISRFPDARFVLLHCGYPWIEDMSLLVTSYPNVFPDLSWVPLISTRAGTALVHELIERSTADRIAWGCDTWTPEESYGALLALCNVVAGSLAQKIADGYLSLSDAFGLIDGILFDNPHRLYKSHRAGTIRKEAY